MTAPLWVPPSSPADDRHHGGVPGAWRAPVRLGALAAGALTYTSVIDPNRSAAFPVCPLKLLTGWDCPFCGSQRATHALTHGYLLTALDHNALFVIALPFIIVGWTAWLAASLGWPIRRLQLSTRGWWLVGVAAAVFMVVRNLPTGPFPWLASG